jgi:hypothetical protein
VFTVATIAHSDTMSAFSETVTLPRAIFCTPCVFTALFEIQQGESIGRQSRSRDHERSTVLCRHAIQNLIDYLEGGDSIDEFLEDFPSVSRDQVISFLEEAKESILARAV